MLGMLSPDVGFPTAHSSTRQGAGALGERVIYVGCWLQTVSAGADCGCWACTPWKWGEVAIFPIWLRFQVRYVSWLGTQASLLEVSVLARGFICRKAEADAQSPPRQVAPGDVHPYY